MSETTEFETDAFLKLLTDALRAGPGSPQWHEAVTQLRAAGESAETDEYRLLLTARERIESGREYRSVRAGPGFTRKVMDTLETEAARPRNTVSTASVIAFVAVGLILAVVVSVAVMLLRSDPAERTIQDLRATAFSTTLIPGDFSTSISAEWNTFGIPPVIPNMENTLQPGTLPDGAPPKGFVGGGLVSATPFPPDQSLQLDLSALVDKPTDQVVLQLFVTDNPTFDRNSETTTPSEIAVNLRRTELVVVKPDGALVGESGRVPTDRPVHVLVKLDQRFVIVEDGAGRELFAGEHGLSTDKPRRVGLRFLTTGKQTDRVRVQSLRVLKP